MVQHRERGAQVWMVAARLQAGRGAVLVDQMAPVLPGFDVGVEGDGGAEMPGRFLP